MTIARAQVDVADHGEGGRRYAGQEGDDVLKSPDCGGREGPEISDHRRREHHRIRITVVQTMPELAIDQIGQQKAQHRLDDDGGDDKAPSPACPLDVRSADVLALADADPAEDGGVGRLAR
jgi:hypothetical protein